MNRLNRGPPVTKAPTVPMKRIDHRETTLAMPINWEPNNTRQTIVTANEHIIATRNSKSMLRKNSATVVVLLSSGTIDGMIEDIITVDVIVVGE